MTKLLSFAPILLATRSKCVSEDSKKVKTGSTKKKNVDNFFDKISTTKYEQYIHTDIYMYILINIYIHIPV